MSALRASGFGRAVSQPIAPAEQRGTPRFALMIRAAKIVVDELEYPCVLNDISSAGARIRHLGFLPDAQSFALELANGERLAVEQVWADETFAGVRFYKEIDPARLASMTSRGRHKRKLRLAVSAPATVSWKDNRSSAMLVNLSQQGCCIECDSQLAIDQLVRIACGVLPQTFGKVRWRDGRRHGVVFENTLSFEQLAAAVASMNRANAAAR